MRLKKALKNPKRYVNGVCNSREYNIDIITVEHRCNNFKRDFLFVNKKQCKHIPCSPSEMIDMCKALANQVGQSISENEKVLVVGFAETATAIGSIVAENLPQAKYVLHTTREKVEGSKQIITFEEEHSHATTQLLLTYNDDREINLDDYTYILFVEDEISTGNTILNFSREFEKVKPGMKFGVASICNWQTPENIDKFKEYGIDRYALITGDLIDTNVKIFDESIICLSLDKNRNLEECSEYIDEIDLRKDKDTFKKERLGHSSNRELTDLELILDKCKDAESVRVIGTEEFMAIPIKIGKALEDNGLDVICHSTTRSRINVMSESKYDGEGNGIKVRSIIQSAYESGRNTFIYNTEEKTDIVLAVTDTLNDEQYNKFKDSLYNIFKHNCSKLIVVRY